MSSACEVVLRLASFHADIGDTKKAQALTEQARITQFQLGITEQDVLEKMLQALTQEGSPVPANEAQWVVRRLAELLDWPPLTDDLAR